MAQTGHSSAFRALWAVEPTYRGRRSNRLAVTPEPAVTIGGTRSVWVVAPRNGSMALTLIAFAIASGAV
jgi:hypothetical protein